MEDSYRIFDRLDSFESDVQRLENKILELEHRIAQLIQTERNHLIRVKNHEEVSDDFLSQGRPYQDLSPDKAFKFYQNKDFNFILIDVTSKNYRPIQRIPEALHLPWEDFKLRFLEIQTKNIPILIISEDGTNSILACNFLVKRGFFNCNNISGGYLFWKGIIKELTDLSA